VYSTCLFCHGSLGRNERIEHFPVGRRLAFDAAKGRLWVVCPGCSRWNLTPLEERWEAIEECERLFPLAVQRVGTENVALARDRSGLDLVRVGRVARRELGHWRFATRMRRQHRIALVGTAIERLNENQVAVTYSLAAASSIVGFKLFVVPIALRAAWQAFDHHRVRRMTARPALRVSGRDGEPVTVTAADLMSARIREEDDGSSSVRIRRNARVYDLTGDVANRALGIAVSVLNRGGAREAEIDFASSRLADIGRPADYLDAIVREQRRMQDRHAGRFGRRTDAPIDQSIDTLDRFTQITLDMALSEHADDASTAAELSALESAWLEAEEIAAIADGLLVPDEVARRMKEIRAADE
jgi:hypothetical protein